MTACYVDSSALVKLATHETESDALRKAIGGFEVRFTSRVAEVEVARALLRRGAASAQRLEHVGVVLQGLIVVELEESIASLAGTVGPPTLRSLDAIHLASALAARDELAAFVTYDRRLADAARAAGLNVVAPA